MLNWAQELEDDFQWREAELATFKVLIMRADEGTARHKALLRALWVMLYAHYEGYCKFVLQTYLDALMQRKLPRIDYKDPIIAFSMQGKFRHLSDNLSNDNCVRFIQQFPVDLNNPVFEFDDNLSNDKRRLKATGILFQIYSNGTAEASVSHTIRSRQIGCIWGIWWTEEIILPMESYYPSKTSKSIKTVRMPLLMSCSGLLLP